MGKAKPLTVAGHLFRTRDSAKEFFSDMLSRYTIGDEVSSDDARFLSDLLKRHPSSSEKIGVGVAAFLVIADGFGGQCFAVRRVDQTVDDFSYKKCVAPS